MQKKVIIVGSGNAALSAGIAYSDGPLWLAFTYQKHESWAATTLHGAATAASTTTDSNGDTTTNGFCLSNSAEPPAISQTQSRCLFLLKVPFFPLSERILAEPLNGAIGLIPVASVTLPGTQSFALNPSGCSELAGFDAVAGARVPSGSKLVCSET